MSHKRRGFSSIWQLKLMLEMGRILCFGGTGGWRGESVQELDPNLSKTIPGRISKKRTVAQGLLERKWVSDMRRALTVPVILEYLLL
jgi:hypothetical protein